MKISFSPISETNVHEIVDWKYDPPYHIYNLNDNREVIEYVLDPQNNFWGMQHSDELIGFCSYGLDGQVPGGDYRDDALDIGMGIRPDLTGQGNGHTFVAATLDFGARKFSPEKFRVTIAKFNQRAQRAWKKNGFQPVQTFVNQRSQREFVVMTKTVNQETNQQKGIFDE